jgi:hypothetical protein
MKKMIVLVAVCIALGLVSKAQCDQNIKWTSSKSEFIDASGTIERSEDETVIVTTSATKISIVPHGSSEETLTGNISDYACNWADKQNGKTNFKSLLTDSRGDTLHATIAVEAVNGKTTIFLEATEMPSKIRLSINSFEEVK